MGEAATNTSDDCDGLVLRSADDDPWLRKRAQDDRRVCELSDEDVEADRSAK
jgi:hypothetical protein